MADKKNNDNIIQLPDHRAMERSLNHLTGSGRQTDLDQAQELMYDAWESDDPYERIELAEKALELSPDCADAWVLLAEDTAESLDQALDFYQKGVEASERVLGKAVFKEDVGHFWGILETRPYMRARLGQAECLWLLGDQDAAISHYQAMLELNPNDNQGIRYLLLVCLMTTKQYDATRKLLKTYEGEPSAAWTYTEALLAFAEEGDNSTSRAYRKTAFTTNKHIPAYLGGRRKPPKFPPAYIGIGDKNEAVSYTLENRDIWREITGAIPWLLKALKK